MHQTILTRYTKDKAWHLPAINAGFTAYLHKSLFDIRGNDQPETLDCIDRLNNFSQDAFCYYPRALYSFALARKNWTREKIEQNEPFLLERNRNETEIDADCGAYSWVTDEEFPYNPDAPEHLLGLNLRWQEIVCNRGMILECPVWGIDHPKRKITYPCNTYDECLDRTVMHVRFFDENQTGVIPFMNPLHGRTPEEAVHWYKRVKFFEGDGYALARPVNAKPEIFLAVLHELHVDGELHRINRLHFFGKGAPRNGIAYTTLQIIIRDLTGTEAFQITYDTATAIRLAMKVGSVIVPKYHDPDSPYDVWDQDQFCENLKTVLPNKPYPYAPSPVLNRINAGDILKSGGGFDQLSRLIMLAHNISFLLLTDLSSQLRLKPVLTEARSQLEPLLEKIGTLSPELVNQLNAVLKSENGYGVVGQEIIDQINTELAFKDLLMGEQSVDAALRKYGDSLTRTLK